MFAFTNYGAGQRGAQRLGWAGALLLVAACDSKQSTGDAGGAATVADASSMEDENEMSPSDAEDASGEDDTDGGESTSSDAADGQRPALGAACASDRDCSDDLVCNGTERCVKLNGVGTCAAGDDAPVCTFEHPCREETKGCDCRDDDADNDGYGARECGGPDCDDSRNDCAPNGIETCDPGNHDEDCNAGTVSTHDIDPTSKDGDTDGDGYVDKRCKNFDPVARKWHTGDDCDDLNRYIRPLIPEVCNYVDDNCDGLIDEAVDPTSMEKKEGALRNAFYPDRDQDLYADMKATPRVECVQRIPLGYVFPTANDCDDDPRTGGKIHPNAVELCDGVDNDCDGAKDEASDVRIDLDFEDTTLQCIDGAVAITACPPDKLHCPGTPLERGCSTDATRLTSCRACNTDCRFSCGQKGCDEIADVSVGSAHACAVTNEGRVACWGRGESGRLGNDSQASSALPRAVSALRDASLVVAGPTHSCAVLKPDGALYCWGSNEFGQLGSADVNVGDWSSVPVPVAGVDSPRLLRVTSVALAQSSTCAVFDGGSLACWGLGTGGMLANGSASATVYPAPEIAFNSDSIEIDDAVEVALGGHHGCMLSTSGTVLCWGDNSAGQLGDGKASATATLAQEVPDLVQVTGLTAGDVHSCVISAGRVACWGSNTRLQLGHASTSSPENARPTPIEAIAHASKVESGRTYTCALGTTSAAATGPDRLLCWGSNAYGERASADLRDTATPTPVPLQQVSSFSAGDESACAVDAMGSARCWGHNIHGELGNGTTTTKLQSDPKQVSPLE